MNHTKKILLTATLLLMTFAVVVFNSCRRDPCRNIYCQNGGACSGGGCVCPSGFTGSRCEYLAYSSITYYNNTYTPVYIRINGSNATIPAGGSVVYDGIPGDYADGTAYTFGQTSSGIQVGQEMQWSFNDIFPSYGTNEVDINVSEDFFFLKIRNNSPYNVSQLYVNDGLSSQSFDNIYVPNDGYTYDIGYYPAWTNSNATVLTASGYTIGHRNFALSFTLNQGYIYTVN